jgi:hypothetical protein
METATYISAEGVTTLDIAADLIFPVEGGNNKEVDKQRSMTLRDNLMRFEFEGKLLFRAIVRHKDGSVDDVTTPREARKAYTINITSPLSSRVMYNLLIHQDVESFYAVRTPYNNGCAQARTRAARLRKRPPPRRNGRVVRSRDGRPLLRAPAPQFRQESTRSHAKTASPRESPLQARASEIPSATLACTVTSHGRTPVYDVG